MFDIEYPEMGLRLTGIRLSASRCNARLQINSKSEDGGEQPLGGNLIGGDSIDGAGMH